MSLLASLRDRWLDPPDGCDANEILDRLVCASDIRDYLRGIAILAAYENGEGEIEEETQKAKAAIHEMNEIEDRLLMEDDRLERGDIREYFEEIYNRRKS